MIEYHAGKTRRVWDLIGFITEEQFLAENVCLRGSIRNLLVHPASTDRSWLVGLKNLKDVGHVKFEEYPSRESARSLFEQVEKDLMDFVATLIEAELEQNPNNVPASRWQVLMQ
jgi:uncharacterized damage-inducible protein DinB